MELAHLKNLHQQAKGTPKIHPGIPKIYCFLRNPKQKYNFLVMEKLGENLEDLFQRCNRQVKLLV